MFGKYRSKRPRRTSQLIIGFAAAAAAVLMGGGGVNELSAASDSVASTADPTNVKQGIYTDEQARRGNQVYASHCSSCHLPSMMGREPAPALAGELFMSKWRGLSLGDLYVPIATTMPVGVPGVLSDEQYVDLVALILQANNLPANNIELKADLQYLAGINIQ